MDTVYIVIKTFNDTEYRLTRLNEAVFNSEIKANDYISMRKGIKDEDDKDCAFIVEPWHVQ